MKQWRYGGNSSHLFQFSTAQYWPYNALDRVCFSEIMKAAKLGVSFAGEGADEIQTDIHAWRTATLRGWGGE